MAIAFSPHDMASLGEKFQQAFAFHRRGELRKAETLYREILELQPRHADTLNMLGVLGVDSGHALAGLAHIDRALALSPRHPLAHFSRGQALKALKRLPEALQSYDNALALRPDFSEAHYNRGNTLVDLSRLDEALASFDSALQLRPGYVPAHINRGNTLLGLKQPERAISDFERALVLEPRSPDALRGRVRALVNLGNTLLDVRRAEEALQRYESALQIAPDDVRALNGRGNALWVLRRYDEAYATYLCAVARDEAFLPALNNLGNLLLDQARPDEARQWFARLVQIAPDNENALGNLFHAQLHCCDWAQYDSQRAQVVEGVIAGRPASGPFPFLAASRSAAQELECARLFTTRCHPPATVAVWNGERHEHDRIRVAYLSADFYNHATACLAAELFERHDRERFEVTAISFGPHDGSAMRDRLERAFERFLDVRDLDALAIAARVRELEIDIVVDLKGFTAGCRPDILAQRPAPLQVSYLGYPGTMGAPYIDYILADRHVIPPEHQEFYSEKVVYLPESYQPNHSTRAIDNPAPTRAQASLPERAFVFCCFNSPYKLTPEMFDIWMRLLNRVPESVLWLLADDEVVRQNLRREAQMRGVAAERLVFASRQPMQAHLSRHALADLFLDTLPIGAHTTASDALWTGLPVLTCTGDSFAGRVGTSLLHAVGLPELVTDNLRDYEALAARLALDPAQLRSMRRRLCENLQTCALFDADRMRRHVESAFTSMHARHMSGAPPGPFAVEALPVASSDPT